MKRHLLKSLSVLITLSLVIFVMPRFTFAAANTKFMEPGGDADFAHTATNGFWDNVSNGVVATDFVHGSHVKSLAFGPGATAHVSRKDAVLSDTGSRVSAYFYFVAFSATVGAFMESTNAPLTQFNWRLRVTSAGVLQFWDGTVAQRGSDGPTLSTGQWYRISIAYTITSGSVNRFEVFVDGVSAISLTDVTLTNVATSKLRIGKMDGTSTQDFRASDIYVDDSASLTDTGDVWVTAKRPVSNGTTNGFTTQVGVSGSGYGSGHSPQVNERALSTTNGWSMVGAGAAVTEEYNIEDKATGDFNLTNTPNTFYTIVDYVGWASMKSLAPETAQIIVDGVSTPQAITSTNTIYTKAAGSTSYPSGTGADIGITTDTSLTTVTLNEAGILVAFIPHAPSHGIVTVPGAVFTLPTGTLTIP